MPTLPSGEPTSQPATPLVAPRSIRTYVAGLKYRATQEKLALIRAAHNLGLCREPENAHDPNAIRVTHLGSHIGYVPAADAKCIAPLMDRGWLATASVSGTRAGQAPAEWHVGMAVRLMPGGVA